MSMNMNMYSRENAHDYWVEQLNIYKYEQGIDTIHPKERSLPVTGCNTPTTRAAAYSNNHEVFTPLSSSATWPTSQNKGKCYPQVEECYKVAIGKCRGMLQTFIALDSACAWLMIPLVYGQACGLAKLSVDTSGKRENMEQTLIAIELLEPFKRRFPIISYSDLLQLASALSVEALGGPHVPFHPGRMDLEQRDKDEPEKDGLLPDDTLENDHMRNVSTRIRGLSDEDLHTMFSGLTMGCCQRPCTSNPLDELPKECHLPNAIWGSDLLRDVFVKTMRFCDKDIVTLIGGGTLGYFFPWFKGCTNDPLIFDNSYFKELLSKEKQGFFDSPTDKSFLEDPGFRPLVEKYAVDKAAFFADYAEAHTKLSELGFSGA